MAIKIQHPFEQEFWPCFTDIMSGLFALVILILVISLICQKGLVNRIKAQEQKLLEIKMRGERLEKDLQDAIKAGLITIKDGHIDIQGNILFQTGSSQVTEEGKGLLQNLAKPLSTFISGSEDMIMVSGFTDDVKILNSRFASNWELSTGRATEVAKLLISFGVSPDKIFAAGFGEFHPIVANSDEAGRKRNRRVEISRVPVRLSQQVK